VVLFLGRDEDKNGVMFDLVVKSLKTKEESEEEVVASGGLGVLR
jgi:hypothetical protein